MAGLGNLVATVGADLRNWNQAMGTVKRDVNRMTSNFQAAGRTMTAAFTAPIGYLAGTGFQTFRNFEQQMAKVKAVSGAVDSEFASLTKTAKDLGSTTRFTATEVAGLQLEYAKLGFTTEEINNVTEATLNLAQATDSDLSQAAEVAGSTLRAFGLDASETARVADVMAFSFSNSALDMDRFQESMKFVAPVAKSAGMSIEETTAMLEVLSNAGIKGSQAGTALRRIISDLGDTGGDTAGAIQKLAGEGITMSSAMDEVGRNAQSALLVLAEGSGDFDRLTKELEDSGGAAKTMADIMDNTAEGGIKKMQSAIEGAQLVIGEALAPAVTSLAGNVADLAGWFTTLDSDSQSLVMAFGGILAATGPMLIAIPKLVQGFGMMKVAVVKGVIPALTKMTAVMLANPIAAVTVAVVALGFALKDYVHFQDAATAAEANYQSAVTDANVITAKKMANVERLASIVENEARSEDLRRTALEKLNSIAPDYFSNLDLEAVKTGALTTAVDQYRESLLRAAKTKVFQQQLEENVAKMEELKAELAEGPSLMDQILGAGSAAGSHAASIQRLGGEMGETQKTIDKLTEALAELEGSQSSAETGTQDLTTKTAAAKNEYKQLAEAATSAAEAIERGPDMEGIDSIGQDAPTQELQGGMVDIGAEDSTEGVNETFDTIDERMQKTMGLADEFGGTVGAALGSVVSGSAEAGEAMKQAGLSMLKSLIGIAKANVIAAMSSPANPINAASGGLAMPAVIGGGLALVEGLLGAIAFADGGIVSGPTMGLVGEYRGARNNPEVIAPLDKLKGMIADTQGGGNGNGGGTLRAVVKGSDLAFILKRGEKDLNRKRG